MYLGVKFNADKRMEGELDRRIGIAMSAVEALQKKVFGSRELSKKANVEAKVVPMMTYGCESWVLREREDQAAGIRNECIKEDSRCDQARMY